MLEASAASGTAKRPSSQRFWLGAGTTTAALLIWELASRTGALPSDSVPAMSVVFRQLGTLLGTADYWTALQQTLVGALIGLALVVVIGVPMALAIGALKFVRDSTWLLVEFLKPIPPVAIIPLALLLWGPTASMKIYLVTFGALWPFLIQMVYGVSQVDPVHRLMSRSYRLGGWTTATRVTFPAVLPYAMTGLRVSASIAIIVSVVTELVGGAPGLGRDIVVAQSASDLPTVYALIVTTGVLGIAVSSFLGAIEQRILFWHPSHRKVV